MNRPIDPRRIEVVDEATAAVLRTMLPHERIAMASALHEEARQLIADAVRMVHPDWTREQAQREVVRCMLGGQEWTPRGVVKTVLPPGFD